MFIDETYFYGVLAIGNISEVNVISNVRNLIAKYEPEFLTRLMEYELYRDLKAGLLVDPVAQKWQDVMNGKEYTNRKGMLTFWPGLLTTPDSITVDTKFPADIPFTVDVTAGVVSGQPSYRNIALAGKRYRVVERVTGPLKETTEYTVYAGGGFDMVGRNLNTLAVYNIEFLDPVKTVLPGNAVEGTAKESCIAMYCYYHISRDNQTQTTGSGEKTIYNENANNEDSRFKQDRAWNNMQQIAVQFREFMLSNTDVYPQYVDPLRFSVNHWLDGGYGRYKNKERIELLEKIPMHGLGI